MRVEIVRKAFGKTEILRNIAFSVEPGETIALTGPSGIGKSTILRIVAGLDTDFTGRIDGAGRLAMVFQEPTLLPWRTVRDNLTLASGCSAAEADRLLESVGLAKTAERFPTTLSLGQARRVGLARGFAAEPETLLLDEAFASLDRANAERMQATLETLLQGRRTRVLTVTHDPAEAARLATSVLCVGGQPARIALRIELPGLPGKRTEADIARLAREIGDAA